MEEYRAYFVGRDGHFNGFEPIVCPNDAAAIENAKRLVNKHGVELGAVRGLWLGLSPCNHPMNFTRPTQAENTTTTTAMKRRPR
jgi:hypothetical protein